MKAVVVTVSTRAAHGVYADEAGPAVARSLGDAGFDVDDLLVVPDGIDEVSAALEQAWAGDPDLIVTNGGTGVHPNDVTPEATRAFVDREVPGVAEAMRAASVRVTPMAMLSRAVVGVRGRCLVLNLPGSPKAALENLEVVVPVLRHALDQLGGGDHLR